MADALHVPLAPDDLPRSPTGRVPQWVLDESTVASAMLVVICYVAVYALGTLAGVLCGYPLIEALFDAVSAGSNSGLSCGITSPAMPTFLKVVYILEMWVGRLEFMGVIALFGFAAALARGK